MLSSLAINAFISSVERVCLRCKMRSLPATDTFAFHLAADWCHMWLVDVCCFMLDQTTSSSAMYFSVSFDGSIVTISMDKSTRFRLDISASLGLLQYWCHTPILDQPPRGPQPRLGEADGLSLESLHKKEKYSGRLLCDTVFRS